MYKITLMMVLTLIMSILMMTMCMLLYKKSYTDREKMSPFECGFDPNSSSRIPFSIQFFLIAVLFLIFDIEIIIILPLISMSKSMVIMKWFYTTMMFFMILLVGLYHEWNNGVLDWAK